MIDALDVRTLFFVMTATAMLAAVATTVLWLSYPQEPALPAWSAGAILCAFGDLGIALRGNIPIFVSIVVANVCIAVGHGLFLYGARRFVGDRPLSRWVLVAVALFIFVSFYYFSAIHESTAARIAIQFVCVAALSFATAWHFWRHAGAIRGQVGHVVAVSFCIVGVVLLLRVVLSLFQTPDQDFFRPDRSHQVAFFLFILFYASLMYSFPVLLISKELTRRESAEAASTLYAASMERNAQNLEEVQRIANVGSWEFDQQTRQLAWSAETYRIFRRDPALGAPTLEDYLALLHPDDRPRLLRHMKDIAITAQPYDVELRHLRPDGSYSFTVTRARPVFEGGKLKKVFGSVHDVTAYKRSEERLLASEQLLRSILESSPIAVRILTLEDNAICFANPAYAQLLNAEAESLDGTNPVRAYARPEEYLATMVRVRSGEAVTNTLMELRVRTEKGRGVGDPGESTRTVWVLASYYPIRYQNREASLAWFVDVTELRAATEAAEAANVAKSTFLANMSHEIRTPMNAVLGLSHLARGKTTDPVQQAYLAKIEHASHHLMAIINDILDFSKIEAGRLEIEDVPFSLPAVLENLEKIQEYRASEKGLALRLEVAAEVPETLRGDPLRIGQVLINFVNNAIKFTEQGEIVISVGVLSRDASTVRLRFAVTDTGVGIAPEVLPGIFEPFRQADASINRRYGGTGLGLAISRQIAESMQGTIGATSTPGQGSCFWLEVPLGIESGIPTEAKVEAGNLSALRQRLQGKRVLVAEDNFFNQQVARELLDDVGIAVALAQNGEEAIAWLDREAFDAVLMDMQMPVLDGLAATRAIRRRADGKILPVIAMTANARSEDERACRDAGMDDFVVKPIKPEALYALLDRWLQPPQDAPAAAEEPQVERRGDAEGTRQPVLLNRDTLDRLTHGSVERMERFMTSYFGSAERALASLEQACRAGDFPAYKAIGHQLKSSSRWLGAETIAAACLELEHLPQDGSAERARQLHAEISAMLVRLRDEIAADGKPPRPA